jgi:hypothetical protein
MKRPPPRSYNVRAAVQGPYRPVPMWRRCLGPLFVIALAIIILAAAIVLVLNLAPVAP